MIRFYLVPVETVALAGGGERRGPKYFGFRGSVTQIVNCQTEQRDYGREPSMLLAASITDPDDALIAAQPDVTKFADNLDTPLGAGLAAMQPALEALKLPASMLTVDSTARQIIRGILAIFDVASCMDGKGFNIFAGGVTLASTMASIPAAPRQALTDCVDANGYDRTGIIGTSTVRQLLVKLVQQGAPRPMLGVTV